MAACIGRGVGSIVSRSSCVRPLVDGFRRVETCSTHTINSLGQTTSLCQRRFYAKQNHGFHRILHVTEPLSMPSSACFPVTIKLGNVQGISAAVCKAFDHSSAKPLNATERRQAVMYVRQVLSRSYIDEVIKQLLAQLNTLSAHSSERKGKLSITVADTEAAINRAIAEVFANLPPRSLHAYRKLLSVISKDSLDVSDLVMVVRCVQNGLIVEGQGVTMIQNVMKSCLQKLFPNENSDEARVLIHTTSVSYAIDVVGCLAGVLRKMKAVIALVETSYSKPLM